MISPSKKESSILPLLERWFLLSTKRWFHERKNSDNTHKLRVLWNNDFNVCLGGPETEHVSKQASSDNDAKRIRWWLIALVITDILGHSKCRGNIMDTTDAASSDALTIISFAQSALGLMCWPRRKRSNSLSTWILHTASNLHDVNIFAQLLHVWLIERDFASKKVRVRNAHAANNLPKHWRTRLWLSSFVNMKLYRPTLWCNKAASCTYETFKCLTHILANQHTSTAHHLHPELLPTIEPPNTEKSWKQGDINTTSCMRVWLACLFIGKASLKTNKPCRLARIKRNLTAGPLVECRTIYDRQAFYLKNAVMSSELKCKHEKDKPANYEWRRVRVPLRMKLEIRDAKHVWTGNLGPATMKGIEGQLPAPRDWAWWHNAVVGLKILHIPSSTYQAIVSNGMLLVAAILHFSAHRQSVCQDNPMLPFAA